MGLLSQHQAMELHHHDRLGRHRGMEPLLQPDPQEVTELLDPGRHNGLQ